MRDAGSASIERELPAGWCWVNLEQVFLSITDGDHSAPPQVDEGIPFLVIGNVRKGAVDFSDVRFVPQDYYESVGESRKPRKGDLLYTVTGSFGIPVLVDSDQEFCVQRHIAILKPASHVSARYLSFGLATAEAYSQAVDAATGTAQKTVGLQRLRQFRVPLAPRPEQNRIVAAIESYVSQLDDSVATLERVVRNLKRYRASVLKSAVEGRLVPTEAALAKQQSCNYEPASALLERILAERRSRWSAAGKNGKYQEPECFDTTNLPDLPEGWCWTTMEALIANGPQNGVYVPKSKYGRGTPIVRIDDYQTDWSRASNELQRIDISDEDVQTYGLRVNDVVINRVNSPSHLGKSLAVTERNIPAVFESNMMRMSLAAGVDARYVQQYLSSTDGKARLIENAKWAVNQASINQRDVNSVVVPLPPAAEQARILTEVNRLVLAAQEVNTVAERSSTRCHRLRQAILKWAFEGRLTDQDSNDEPASVLLERIKAERETDRSALSAPFPRDTSKKKLRV